MSIAVRGTGSTGICVSAFLLEPPDQGYRQRLKWKTENHLGVWKCNRSPKPDEKPGSGFRNGKKNAIEKISCDNRRKFKTKRLQKKILDIYLAFARKCRNRAVWM